MALEGWPFLLPFSSSKYCTVLFPGSRVAEEVKLGSNALIAVFMTRRAAILIGLDVDSIHFGNLGRGHMPGKDGF